VQKQTINAIFKRFQQANPHPVTELIYHNEFELLVAVVLSAQATDKSVNKATEPLFKVADTPKKMWALGEEGIRHYIRSIGLYNAKTKNVHALSGILVNRHKSRVPKTREALEALPGVGRKTANVVLNTLFGEAAIAVDTHIFRVCNRTHLAPGKTPLAVERALMKAVPKVFQQDAHHWLVLHGRYVCTARKPKCPTCLIHDLCEYANKTPGS
jgi:endonuclease-3